MSGPLISWDSPDLKLRGYTVAQAPNAPVIVAVLAAILSRFLDDGTTGFWITRVVFYVAISIWAVMETGWGVNGFRRALGVAGLVFVIASVIRDLS